MKFSHVRAFKAVFELGTVTGAANYLHVTQPAISQLIAVLEEDLGFMLFDRVKGRLYPTSDGRAFYAEVDKVFSGLESLTKHGRALRDQGTQGLSIAAMPLLSSHFIPLVVQKLRQTPQGLGPLRIMTYRSDEVADRVAMQTCDLGFSLEATRSVDVQCIQLACQNVCLVPKSMWKWGRSRALNAEQISQLPLIRHEKDPSQRALDQMLAQQVAPNAGAMEASFSSTIAALVALGEGAAVVDPFTAQVAKQLNASVIAADILAELGFELFVLLPQRRPLSVRGTAFLQAFSDVCHRLSITISAQLLNSNGKAIGGQLTLPEVVEMLQRPRPR